MRPTATKPPRKIANLAAEDIRGAAGSSTDGDRRSGTGGASGSCLTRAAAGTAWLRAPPGTAEEPAGEFVTHPQPFAARAFDEDRHVVAFRALGGAAPPKGAL